MSRACFFLLCPLWLSLGLFWASSFLQNQNDGASGCPLGCWPPGRWAPPLEASSDNWLLWRKVAHFSSPCIWLSTGPNKITRSQTCSLVMSPESRVDDNRDPQSHPCCPQVVRLPVRCRVTIAPRWPGHSHWRVGYLDQHLIQCLIESVIKDT